MEDRNEESLDGDEELLPRRGNPFSAKDGSPESSAVDEFGDIIPAGDERSIAENNYSNNPFTEEEDAILPRPREDGSPGAVGPLLPEDIAAVPMPSPIVEPELPSSNPDPTFSTLDRAQEKPQDSLPPFLRSTNSQRPPSQRNLLVSDIRVNWLFEKAHQLEDRINREIENPHLSKLLFEQIGIVRNQSIDTRDQFEEAERVLNEVENRINLAEQVKAWSASIRTRLMLYEAVFLVALGAGLALLPTWIDTLAGRLLDGRDPAIIKSFEVIARSMFYGGLGGLLSALIGLRTHGRLDEDVDRSWAIWYVATPFMGLVLGALLFLATRAGLLLFIPTSSGQIAAAWILYLVSFLLGFQQNIAYDVIERLLSPFNFDHRRLS
ncbi:MAG: hypothetical protein IIC78_03990 [Chloroflexi bacterium]|nr:hypothetical protein [Chloroflexota bacterium]